MYCLPTVYLLFANIIYSFRETFTRDLLTNWINFKALCTFLIENLPKSIDFSVISLLFRKKFSCTNGENTVRHSLGF